MNLSALIVYAHINDFRDFGGNEQNKRSTQATHEDENNHTKRLGDHVK